LFGIGLYLQAESFARQSIDSKAAIKSRLKWLAIIGLVHGIFIWPGDILLTYALCGFLLIKHLQSPSSELLKRGYKFFAIGLVLSTSLAILGFYTDEVPTRESEFYLESLQALSNGYGDYLIENLIFVFAVILMFPLLLLFYITGVMLIGLGLFKSGELSNGFTPTKFTVLVLVTLTFVAMDIAITFISPALAYHASGLVAVVSGLTMALLIWHWVIKSKVYASQNLLVTALKRCGRIALTLYLMQSIIGVMLLRVLFPEWYPEFTLAEFTALAFAIIVFQVVFAYLYLATFKQGPIEVVWRKLVNAGRFKIYSEKQTEQASVN
jgi:uncharacterized protein